MELNSKHLNVEPGSLRRKAGSFLTITLLTALLSSLITIGKAQTWNEFFKQKKTQRKYLLQQIAALEVYIGYVRKGYEIADHGISTVRSIRDGEFGLHSAFFTSLKAVNPAIRNHTKVAEIIAMQLSISSTLKEIKTDDYLSAENLAYVSEVAAVVLKECSADLDELLLVITAGKTEMKDDERLVRLDKVYTSMKDKSAFVQNFFGEVQILTGQRRAEEKSLTDLKQLYESK